MTGSTALRSSCARDDELPIRIEKKEEETLAVRRMPTRRQSRLWHRLFGPDQTSTVEALLRVSFCKLRGAEVLASVSNSSQGGTGNQPLAVWRARS